VSSLSAIRRQSRHSSRSSARLARGGLGLPRCLAANRRGRPRTCRVARSLQDGDDRHVGLRWWLGVDAGDHRTPLQRCERPMRAVVRTTRHGRWRCREPSLLGELSCLGVVLRPRGRTPPGLGRERALVRRRARSPSVPGRAVLPTREAAVPRRPRAAAAVPQRGSWPRMRATRRPKAPSACSANGTFAALPAGPSSVSTEADGIGGSPLVVLA
jgi:hypothetical protein